jgi:hypothetical protein
MILVYFQTLEPENSENSDSDSAITRNAAKSRFVSSQKPVPKRKENRTSQAARFGSENPYFVKEMVESNVRKICRLVKPDSLFCLFFLSCISQSLLLKTSCISKTQFLFHILW